MKQIGQSESYSVVEYPPMGGALIKADVFLSSTNAHLV
jgi:hypothetical protein